MIISLDKAKNPTKVTIVLNPLNTSGVQVHYSTPINKIKQNIRVYSNIFHVLSLQNEIRYWVVLVSYNKKTQIGELSKYEINADEYASLNSFVAKFATSLGIPQEPCIYPLNELKTPQKPQIVSKRIVSAIMELSV